MENKDKMGKVISDKEMKKIKKIFKNLVHTGPSIIPNEHFDSDLIGSKIKIANIRKYKHIRTCWFDNQEQYVYEIDVIVDMNTTDYYSKSRTRRFNRWYRNSILKILNYESFLKYFNIDVNNEAVISKIKYEKIG